MRRAFDHARPGDERQRAIAAEDDAADLDRAHRAILAATYGAARRRGCAPPRPLLANRYRTPSRNLQIFVQPARLVPVRRADEAAEQRMRAQRLRAELGMELH